MDGIETERLLLRPFLPGDGPILHSIVGNDPEMTWETTSWPYERTLEFLDIRLGHFAKYGFGVWAVIEKNTHELVGQAGLQYMENGNGVVEIVVYTAKKYWHQGIGFEACTAALKYGFLKLGLPKIVAVTRIHNINSQKLMEKLGFKFIRKDTAYGFDVLYYELYADEFEPKDSFYKVYDLPVTGKSNRN